MDRVQKMQGRYRAEERVIRSYGADPVTIPADKADLMISMGDSHGARVCKSCFAFYYPKHKSRKCPACINNAKIKHLKMRTLAGEDIDFERVRKVGLVQVRACRMFFRKYLSQTPNPLLAFVRAIEQTSDDAVSRLDARQRSFLEIELKNREIA